MPVLFFSATAITLAAGDVAATPGALNLAPEPTRDVLSVLSSGERGLVLELALDTFNLAVTTEGVVASAPGLYQLAQPGEPDLPGRIALVGIPQQGEIRLSAEASDVETFEGVTVRPAPGFTEGSQKPRAKSQRRDWAEVEKIDIVRGVRVAFVRLNPVQYDSEKKTVRAARRLKVSILFTRPGIDVPSTDRFDPILETALVNGVMAKNWKPSGPSIRKESSGNSAISRAGFYARSEIWCKVKTETTGVYRITPADIEKAGFSATVINPTTFKLYTLGPYRINESYPDTMVEVPVYVKGEEDGRFDKADFLAFYAEKTSGWDSVHNQWQENLFTDYRYFWLTWGGEPGRRMASVSGAGATRPTTTAPAHVRVEEDLLCPARSGLLWLWQKYFKQAGVDSVANRVEIPLPGRTSIEEISGRMYAARAEGDTVSKHFCRLYLNGVLLESLWMRPSHSCPPPADFVLDSIPPETRRPVGQPDTLTIEIYGDPEMVDYLDFLQVRYTQELKLSSARPFLRFFFADSGPVEFAVEGGAGEVLLLDVTDWRAPKRIVDTEVSGSTRKAKVEVRGMGEFCCALVANLRPVLTLEPRRPGSLLDQAEQADYYIICPDEFHAAARMFARYREGNVRGIPSARVRAVRLSDIYDDYTFGMEEPAAIQRFLADKQPVYGLLAGDATYDYRNRLGLGHMPSVPAYEMGYDIDPEVYGMTAKAYDAWYADFQGQGGAPDMVLARITCRSAVELRRFLDKVKTYETQPLGFWAKRFVLLADDEWLGQPGKRDPIGFSHIVGCENIVLFTRNLLDPVKIYLTEYPYTGVNDKAGARTDLLNQLNQGALFWCFFGHGAGFQLCHERTLSIDGVPQVTNGGRNPLAFFGSCGVGRFEDTRYEAIAEELVRKESGCIATYGASKATTPGSNELFARTLFGRLAENDSLPVGASFFPAWLTYTIYHMFGDPGMMLRLPKPGIPPIVTPDTLYPGGTNTVSDSVPVQKGRYGISVRELDWYRTYSSEAGAVSYVLPGYRLQEALGTFDSGQVECSFLVPRLDYPDTLIVPNGKYIRQPNTASVSLLAWDNQTGYSARKKTLALGDTVTVTDRAAPELMLFADRRPLAVRDTTDVPRRFTLEGIISDPSGILLAAVPDYSLSLYIGARTSGRIDLLPVFGYDQNSTTTGRFSYPVEISKELDSLTVVASDNLRNRLVATAYVRAEMSDELRIENVLVYPNPVSGPATFTFELSRAASVSIKVYTISGRLVRCLLEQPCSYGYNQVEWDGRDEEGRTLANGVYLYKIDARVSEPGVVQTRAARRDRLLVQY